MKNRIWQLQFKSQQAIPWLFSLMLPEIAGQKVKISTDLETLYKARSFLKPSY